jgi:hypothetical protein
MEIIEDRHGNRSTIITSQLPVSQWYEVIGEQTIADAILDRIVYDAHRMELLGESLRRMQKNKIMEEVETVWNYLILIKPMRNKEMIILKNVKGGWSSHFGAGWSI